MVLTETATLPPDDLSLLDRLAELTRGDVHNFNAVRQLYENNPRRAWERTSRVSSTTEWNW
ncbi:MAG: hypothetical protein JW963_25660 [Anaerolineales bacterium]|nr:hypothetical protein [Anaerolineales bacterium]